ncbi:hypothetical protein [Carboxylicivirga sp. RSCT41]|uniref:hypothetical protein n=1 Tax=Carboxylicivirga agarovorans TaxID=3417570 RepID=UPI003D343BF3
MDYQVASNRFSLDKVITKLKGLDFIEIIKELNNEIDSAEFVKIPNKSPYMRDIEYIKIRYISDLKDLEFLFSQG